MEKINKKVYKDGRYKNNINQLIIDFNNLPEVYRDMYKISRLYPDYCFIFDSRDKKIEHIYK